MSENRIPAISDERLKELYTHIKPVKKNMMGELCWLREFDPNKLRSANFSWDDYSREKVSETGVVLASYKEIVCLHKFSTPGLFKPTIAEVLTQISPDDVEKVVAFELVTNPADSRWHYSADFAHQAFADGYHVFVVKLYVRG